MIKLNLTTVCLAALAYYIFLGKSNPEGQEKLDEQLRETSSAVREKAKRLKISMEE
jgi:hypothetical protein